MKHLIATSIFATTCIIALTAATDAATPRHDNSGNVIGAYAPQQFAPMGDSSKATNFTTKAEVAAHVGSGVLLKSKNVTQLTHPSTGIFCFEPSVQLNLLSIYPQVTVDWNLSDGNGLLAYAMSERPDCPKRWVEVTTYELSGTTPRISDNVGFYLYIN